LDARRLTRARTVAARQRGRHSRALVSTMGNEQSTPGEQNAPTAAATPQATVMQAAAEKIEAAAWSAEVAQCLAASPTPHGRVGAGGTLDGQTLVV
jgi:hypothetical protein